MGFHHFFLEREGKLFVEQSAKGGLKNIPLRLGLIIMATVCLRHLTLTRRFPSLHKLE